MPPESTLSPDRETPPIVESPSDTIADLPPRRRTTNPKPNDHRDQSPAASTQDERKGVLGQSFFPYTLDKKTNTLAENLTLPATSYRKNRYSTISTRSDLDSGDGFLIPVAFDPTPPAESPRPKPSRSESNRSEGTKSNLREEQPKDYFNVKPTASSSRKESPEQQRAPAEESNMNNGTTSQPTSPQSPHIAYQQKNRQSTNGILDSLRKQKEQEQAGISGTSSPRPGADVANNAPPASPKLSQPPTEGPKPSDFKLQEVPESKKSRSSSKSSDEVLSPQGEEPPLLTNSRYVPPSKDQEKLAKSPTINTSVGTRDYPAREASIDSSRSFNSPSLSQIQQIPRRGDSLNKDKQIITRKEVPSGGRNSVQQSPTGRGHESSTSSSNAQDSPSLLSKLNGGRTISKPIDSPGSKSIHDIPGSLTQIKGGADDSVTKNVESFTAPRAPPAPPTDYHKGRHQSVSTVYSESSRNGEHNSPTLPRWSGAGAFTMDEDMARVFGADGEPQNRGSILRKVSNAVRHGRSYSDQRTRLTKDPKWPKSPLDSSAFVQEISSPSQYSPENKEDVAWFKSELRNERQRMIEKDQKIAELEAALEGRTNIKQMNNELRVKRSTITELDAQEKIVVRELEVLTENVAAAKKSGEPLNFDRLSSTIVREFAEVMEQLKESYRPQIEELIHERTTLIDEVANLSQMKDMKLKEFEQLSLKNAQLADLNNDLVHQIQELHKAGANTHPEPKPNGLGIYTHHSRDKTSDSKEMRPAISEAMHTDQEAEPVTVLAAPQVVNIRKGKPSKFSWKRGGQNVAKGVKGLKGAFSGPEQTREQREMFTEGVPYGALPAGQEPTLVGSLPRSTSVDPTKSGGFGFFGNQRNKGNPGKNATPASSSSALGTPDAATTLFGSDIEQRAEFEKATIPRIIIRCIEEVELRGMDVEGIYRKSGGSSQVQAIKEGFEKSPNLTYDISDPDLDIHAVTSTLKKYFRSLPTPLITYSVYDLLLDCMGESTDAGTHHHQNAPSVSDQTKIMGMRAAISLLPKTNRSTLEFLCFHLKRVTERHVENLMSPGNMAVVFAPTIMRPESVQREMTDTVKKNESVQFLLENVDEVFSGENI
ncbi:MAG: Rho-type gtpase-activating protein [Cirrosporium novae-zelandiae]|nr:MAG: Rho-type gtpase-activating protein [Cirrosporium novae-zelandiae]